MLSFCWCLLGSLLLFDKTNGIEDPTLPPGLFYPFGEDQGDQTVATGMQGYTEVQLGRTMAFNGATYGKIYVETHGLIAFGQHYPDYTPSRFPILGYDKTFLAPYWAGADTSLNRGRIYYRYTNNSILLKRAEQDVQMELGNTEMLYSFSPDHLFIATWHNVTYSNYGTATSPTNSFQAIIAWTRKATAVLYRYGKLQWTTGGYSGGGGTGLGGTPAAMGFNSGTNDYYFAHAFSMTSDIRNLTSSSNVFINGHYAFRVDKLLNRTDCYDNDDDADDMCPLPYQEYNQVDGMCNDFAPAFSCPGIEGPFERQLNANHKKFEFNCVIMNGSDDSQALYDVDFLFNGQPDCSVPFACQTGLSARIGAKIDSENLRGKQKMGKWIGCRIRSYWDFSTDQKSKYWISNDYYMGLQFSVSSVDVVEDSIIPATIMVKSTVPITCPDSASIGSSKPCSLKLRYNVRDAYGDGSAAGLMALRQYYPGELPLTHGCEYIIKEGDWKASEGHAYEASSPLEVMATLDPYVTGTRTVWMTFTFDDTSQSVWHGFESPVIQLHHHDVKNPMSSCTSTADPHLRTYDGQPYSSHCNGKFDYARSFNGSLGFEVQVRHCPCSPGSLVSCVCGIAIREDNMILIADICNSYKAIQFWGQNNFECKQTADVRTQTCGFFSNGQKFKLVAPSGNRVYGTVYGSYMNAEVVVTARSRNIAGLCGSPDGNPRNDWSNGADGSFITIPPGGDPWPPKNLVDSWSPRRPDESLFEFKENPELPTIIDKTDRRLVNNYCTCSSTRTTCGGTIITDPKWPGEPDFAVSVAPPLHTSADSTCGTWATSSYCRASITRTTKTWPTATKAITEEEANATCWNRIINVKNLGSTCMEIMMNDTETAQKIVTQCVVDVLETEDYSWADDKIPDAQKVCYYDVITRNISEVNDTTEAIELVLESLQEVMDFMCTPIDCNGHGECLNGTCLCEGDYVGSDCAVSKSAIPDITAIFSKSVIDIRDDEYGGVSLIVSDAANIPTMSCKFETQLLNGIQKTYINRGGVTSSTTAVCTFPIEPMNYNSKDLAFEELHEVGFNFSCLSEGSPVVRYTISISNDGENFGSTTAQITLFDSRCMDCSSDGTCTQKASTCLINGYCFDDDEPNPYMEGCEVCDAGQSDDSWTAREVETCPTVWACTENGMCIPDQNFNYTCVWNACGSSPCQNGGTCDNSGTSFVCSCTPFYTGVACETYLDACESSPCLNGGVCNNAGSSFSCTCPPTHTGSLCESVAPTTTETTTTTTTTTIPPVRECGDILHKTSVSTPGWHLGCYIGLGDEDYWSTQCRDTLRGLPDYGSADGLLAAGGNFGCWISNNPADEADSGCIDNYQHDVYISMCANCNFMGVCIRLPNNS